MSMITSVSPHQFFLCSIVVMGITIEEVPPQKRSVSNREILEGIADGSIQTTVSSLHM